MDHGVKGASPTASHERRRRRPVGEPPPLPRDLHGSARVWIVVVILLVLVYWWGRLSGTAGIVQRWMDGVVNDAVVDLRASWRGSLAGDSISSLGWWTLVGLRWCVIVVLVVWKRWRHLAVFAGSVVVVTAVARWFPTAGPEGTGVPGHPSYAAASLAVTLVAVAYGVAPRGRWRLIAQIGSVALCFVVACISILIRQDTASEIVIGLAIGVAIPS